MSLKNAFQIVRLLLGLDSLEYVHNIQSHLSPTMRLKMKVHILAGLGFD